MNTYKTYQEAKIAMPEACICVFKENGKDVFFGVPSRKGSTLRGGSEFAEPFKYCMSVFEFHEKGFELVIGDLYILDDAVYAFGDNKSLCTNEKSIANMQRYILRSAALEQPKQEVEWKNGDECVICDDDFSVVEGCEKYIGEVGVVFGSHVNSKGFNLTLVEFKDGGCFSFMTEMLRKPKSERELVIEQALEVAKEEDTGDDNVFFGRLYDLGMLKSIQE